jgi:hypothetical protein
MTLKIEMIAILSACFVAGCCWFCKKPAEQIRVPVITERPCALPDLPVLPTPKPLPANQCKSPAIACFDIANSVDLADRDSKLKQYIREVRIRCGPREGTDAGPPADAGID